MKKISCFFLFLLVFWIGCQDQSKMVQIPYEKNFYDRLGNLVSFFLMDTTEVTVGQFKKFLAESGHQFDSDLWKDIYNYSPTDDHPMIYVSWNDATAYAKWVGKRLPTEKEWDFAARGGLIDKEYSWGDDESLARDYANYERTGGKDKWDDTTAPVGSFKPNGYGLYDMAGNVREWCLDSSNVNRGGKVLRGGGWTHDSYGLRLAHRNGDNPGHGYYDGYGFRCVLGSN